MNKITKFALLATLAVSVVSCTTNDDRIPSLCESFADYFPVGVMINRSIVRSMNDTTGVYIVKIGDTVKRVMVN